MGFRLGLIGCGRAAEHLYVPALQMVSGGTLVAVTDPLAERRDLIASSFSDCQTYPSIEAMLEQAKLDGVIVATPPKMHIPMVKQVLNAGPAVLVEKPLAPTLDDANELLAMGDAAVQRVMVGYNRRHWQPIVLLRKAMEKRDRSQPIQVETVFDNNVKGWNPLTGIVDPLDDLASHHLDLLRYIFDANIVSVQAQRPDERTIRLQVKMTDGIEATCSHAQCDRTQEHLIVKTQGKTYAARMGSQRILPTGGAMRQAMDFSDKIKGRLTGKKWTLGRSYVVQFENFFQFITNQQTPQPSIHDGIAVIHAVEAARTSAEQSGKEIFIDA